jgi:transposase
MPRAKDLLTDECYDGDWFRVALTERGTTQCIPPRKNLKVQYHNDRECYRQPHRLEIVFGKIKGWRGFATRCAHIFMFASPSQQPAATGCDQRVLSLDC